MVKPKKSKSIIDQRVIEITALNKWFGSFHVLQDINLTVSQGEKIIICGPSEAANQH